MGQPASRTLQIFSSILLSFVFTLFTPPTANATILINEVFPAPTQGNEWIEIYNPDSFDHSLEDMQLYDQLSSPSLLHQWDSNATLASGQFVVIEVSNKLNNSGDGVTLKNSAGQVIDSFSFAIYQTDKSWALNETLQWVLSSPSKGVANFEASSSPNPTPQPSPVPSPSVSPTPTESPSPSPSLQPTPSPSPSPSIPAATLTASEIMACPASGSNEWLELFNNGSEPLTLTNWKVKDSSNNTRVVSGVVPAHGMGLISWGSGLLNNGGDSLSLLDPSGFSLWTIQFEACETNSSWSLVNSSWVLGSPTPSAANLILASPSPSSVSFSPVPTLLPTYSNPPKNALGIAVSSPINTLSEVTAPFSESLPSSSSSRSNLFLNLASSSGSFAQSPHLRVVTIQPSKFAVGSAIIGGLMALTSGLYGIIKIYPLQLAHHD
jgi:hypothetical protein